MTQGVLEVKKQIEQINFYKWMFNEKNIKDVIDNLPIVISVIMNTDTILMNKLQTVCYFINKYYEYAQINEEEEGKIEALKLIKGIVNDDNTIGYLKDPNGLYEIAFRTIRVSPKVGAMITDCALRNYEYDVLAKMKKLN